MGVIATYKGFSIYKVQSDYMAKPYHPEFRQYTLHLNWEDGDLSAMKQKVITFWEQFKDSEHSEYVQAQLNSEPLF